MILVDLFSSRFCSFLSTEHLNNSCHIAGWHPVDNILRAGTRADLPTCTAGWSDECRGGSSVRYKGRSNLRCHIRLGGLTGCYISFRGLTWCHISFSGFTWCHITVGTTRCCIDHVYCNSIQARGAGFHGRRGVCLSWGNVSCSRRVWIRFSKVSSTSTATGRTSTASTRRAPWASKSYASA